MNTLILFALICTINAETFSFSTASTDRKLIELNQFTYGDEGGFFIDVKQTDTTPLTDTEYAGFALIPIIYSLDDLCTISLTKHKQNAVQKGYFFYELQTGKKIDKIPGGTYRFVYFSCGKSSNTGFDVTVSQGYSVNNRFHYLSYGEIPMIKIEEVLSFIMLIFLLAQLYILYKREIHSTQTLVLVFGIVVMCHICFDVLTLKETDARGTSKFKYFDYILRIVETFSFYVVTILVATGWSRKSKFDFNQKKWLLFFIILQLISNILYLVAEEDEMERSRVLFVLRIVDIVCSIGIIFPLIRTLTVLRKTSNPDERTLKQYRRFSRCYTLLLVIAYFKILVAYIADTTPTSKNDYIYLTVDKSLYVIYYIYLMIAFRPKRLFSPKTEAAEEMVVEENNENSQIHEIEEVNDDVKNIVVEQEDEENNEDNVNEQNNQKKDNDIIIDIE